MNSVNNNIYKKLDFFIKKYYTNELLRGCIFFFGLAFIFLFFTVFVESQFWLSSRYRAILLVGFIAIELFLLLRFIFFPLAKLFQLQKGIDFYQASSIIGKHFPEVADKLLNFLQLSNLGRSSELLEASIDQKGNALQLIPFQNAINFSANRRFWPFIFLPLLVIAFIYLSGRSQVLSDSFVRINNFKQQYVAPAPFRFVLDNSDLKVQQGADFYLNVKVVGEIRPENVFIKLGNEQYIMKNIGIGQFQYVFQKPLVDVEFTLNANEVTSVSYLLDVIAVPSISDFSMIASFPSYLNRKAEVIKGSGNAIVPEGTAITWAIRTKATDKVSFVGNDIKVSFVKVADVFKFTRFINDNIDYQISTSNLSISNFEVLSYKISVQKDLFPSISVSQVPDSITRSQNFLVGKVADDHGLSKLQVAYYPRGKTSELKRANIVVKQGIAQSFVFAFPSNLEVVKGVSYEYFFEVFDNDRVHGYKSARSDIFSDKILTDIEKDELQSKQDSESISGMSKSVKQNFKQLQEIEKIQKSAKESDNFDFNEQKKIEDFLKKQNMQDNFVKDFVDKLKESLEKTDSKSNSDLKEELQKRLDNQLKQIEKNQKLIDDLKDLNNKLKKEELSEQLDKFKQSTKNQTKNLEQLVELTKKFYVEKKAEQIIDKLDKLADKQEQLAEDNLENNKENQDKINAEFDKIEDDLKDLRKENNELKAPIDIPNDIEKEKSIDNDLNNASSELKKDNKEGSKNAKPKQKSASKKMKELTAKLKESMDADAMEKMEEDAVMLRQILDNLLSFSFSEESTMSQFKNIKRNAPSYNKSLKQQQDLRLQFQHVDDSLFALGLRNPKISDLINTEVGTVHYSINKAVEVLVESNVSKGVYFQQGAVSSANRLADMLSETLNGMQMEMQGSGKGKPKKGKGKSSGMQLPDIIKKQDGLSKQLEKGVKPGSKSGKSTDGKAKPDGENGKEGQGGQDGEGNAGEIMKIYQEQKQLREALQNELNNKGLGSSGQNILDQMKQLEKQLLNKGFRNDILEKSLNIKQELLKLDKAIKEQGQEEKRQGEGAKLQFNNKTNSLPASVRNYLISTEILNKSTLPFNKNYEKRTQIYFSK